MSHPSVSNSALAIIGKNTPISSERIWVAALASPALVWLTLRLSGLPGQVVYGLLALSILVVLLIGCAITDMRWRRIPNYATYPAFLWALAIGCAFSFSDPRPAEAPAHLGLALANVPVDLRQASAGALMCFLLMLTVHTLSKGGAGDVKLATAIGALLGVKLGLLAICYTFLLAGMMGTAAVIWLMGPVSAGQMFGRWLGSLLLPALVYPPRPEQSQVLYRPLPLGIFFAMGTLLALVGLPGVAL